jgi:hypothetical protein
MGAAETAVLRGSDARTDRGIGVASEGERDPREAGLDANHRTLWRFVLSSE